MLLSRFSVLLIAVLFTCPVFGQYAEKDYVKEEVYITMRDGVKLFTSIYRPKKAKEDLPVLIKRTPYSCAPYGKELMENITHNPHLIASGYIFVFQDMRGRYMSEGTFENTRPPYSFFDKNKTDEITDTYDTYTWLTENLKNFNGNIGQYGNSYLGHTALLAALTGHPALKAVMPMAPVTNFYFEDFNRYGLFAANYLPILNYFGVDMKNPVKDWSAYDFPKPYVTDAEHKLTEDYYGYFIRLQSLKNMEEMLHPDNFFWKNIKAHPDYDEYRQKRDWIRYLDSAKCKVMVVGGWNDEQNLYGILQSYQKLDKAVPHLNPQLVLGPWSHGHNKRREGSYRLGNIYYGDSISERFQREIEFPYFEYYLKNRGKAPEFAARVFDMGTHQWENFTSNPFVKATDTLTYYLNPNGSLNNEQPEGFSSFISDPDRPVPFIEDDHFHNMAPKHYMNDDQRFTFKRPDVLSFSSDILTDSVKVSGLISALIDFSTDHEDADLYVKIIDVLPMDRIPQSTDPEGVKMSGYQKLVRVGYIRGRYRETFEEGKPFTKDEKTTVNVPLLDVHHTFLPGHRIMIQIQSSMFPLFDINPQQWVDNIYEADTEDFERALHKVYGSSVIVLPVVE
ncbi:MAG: CocE/NonD family hydrolase [Brumimicrobium sp.]|nr:CocE/NonD family hydrolase [Brumimicrobium sp.]